MAGGQKGGREPREDVGGAGVNPELQEFLQGQVQGDSQERCQGC